MAIFDPNPIDGRSGRSWRGLAAGGAAACLVVGVAAAGVAVVGDGIEAKRGENSAALAGEARRGSLTVALGPAAQGVTITPARGPGRPLVVIDAGHGGRDPGAPGVSGTITEKQLTLAMARELRDRLAKTGRVRVALTRDGDTTLELHQRAAIARAIGADLFVSIHADSAPNPLARGATVYSLADVASDPAAARLAMVHNAAFARVSSDPDSSVRTMLADLALRDEMGQSADVASRLVRKASGRIGLRPEPHRFAAFHVLRGAQAPAILFEAGYISNADDEAMLLSSEGRARIVAALAATIEADLAARRTDR